MDSEQVRRLRVRRKGEPEFGFVRAIEQDPQGKSGPVWKLESDTELSADRAKISGMLSSLEALKAQKTQAASKPSECGLAKGEGTEITVSLVSGDELTLQISDQRDDDTHFARASGGPMTSIFTLSSTQAEKLSRAQKDLMN